MGLEILEDAHGGLIAEVGVAGVKDGGTTTAHLIVIPAKK